MKVYQKDENGELIEFDLDKYLSELKNELSEIEVYLKKGQKSIRIRLVITTVPKSVMDERLRKINQKNQKKGRTTTDRTKRRQAFNLLISNVPAEVVILAEKEYQELEGQLLKQIIRSGGRFLLSIHDLDENQVEKQIMNKESQPLLRAADFRRLYSIRWQIEIIFKNWKSHFSLNKVSRKKECVVKCQIYAKLLYIFITHKIIFMATNLLWDSKKQEVSILSAGKHLKVVAGEWFRAVINESQKTIEILTDAIEFLMRNCVKSQKKEDQSPREILAEVIKLDFNFY